MHVSFNMKNNRLVLLLKLPWLCQLKAFFLNMFARPQMTFQDSVQFSSVQSLSRVRLFATPWTSARQASLSITNSRSYPNPCPLSQWCHPTISSSVVPFSFCPQSFPALGSFQMRQLFATGGQSIGVSASTSVLPVNTKDWSPLGGLVGSPCSPRETQESSPTPQFKSINSLALSCLHSLTLTSIHDYWKNHSLDYMDVSWQSNVSAF